MGAACSFETSVNIHQNTLRYITEESNVHSYSSENLKFHMWLIAGANISIGLVMKWRNWDVLIAFYIYIRVINTKATRLQ